MTTVQNPQTMWNPAAPNAGVNGHSTRIADVFGNVTPQGFAMGGIPTPTVNPLLNFAHEIAALNPLAAHAFATNPFATVNPYATVNPFATVNPYATLNPHVAMNPYATINPLAWGCPTAAFGSFVNPLAQTFHPQISAWNTPFAVNPFATVNPYGTVNPYVAQTLVQQQLAAAAHLTPTVNPFVNPLNTPVTNYVNPHVTPGFGTTVNPYVNNVQPTVNPFQTATINPLVTPNLTTGIPNTIPTTFPTNLAGIQHPAFVNPWINNCVTPTLNTIPTTHPLFQGLHTSWTGSAFPGVFNTGVNHFPVDSFLGLARTAGLHGVFGGGLHGLNPYATINTVLTNPWLTTACNTNPYLTNGITTNPYVNPYITNPYVANTIAATTLNPWARTAINHPFAAACGLNPLGATFGVC